MRDREVKKLRRCANPDGPYACNNMVTSVCPFFRSCIGNVPFPEPFFDQLHISVCSGEIDLFALIEQNFGKPIGKAPVNKKANNNSSAGLEYWRFANGLFLSEPNQYGYRLIRLEANDTLQTELNAVLQTLPIELGGKKAYQLHTAERAIDIPLSNVSYHRARCLLIQFAWHFVPKNPYLRLKVVSGEKQKTSDGAVNGELTCYFGRVAQGGGGRLIQSRFSTLKAKTYLKRMNGLWCIRVEFTLTKNALSRRFTRAFPLSCKANKDTDVQSLFSLIDFDWGKFTSTVIGMMNGKHTPRRLTIGTALSSYCKSPASTQKRLARYIAILLSSEYLKRKIGSGYFDVPVKIFKQ